MPLRNHVPGSWPLRALGLLTFLVVLPLVSALALSLLGLPVKGFEWLHPREEVAPPPAKPKVTVVDFTETPANTVVSRLFKDLDRAWQASSQPVPSAGLPYPLDCVRPAPSLSDSKAYVVEGTETQVTVAAYPAGVGSEMFRRFLSDTAECQASSTYTYSYGREDLGVEAATMEVSWSSNDIETTFFRRGDLIAFVATTDGVDSYARARTVDRLLARRLTPDLCVDQQAGIASQYRNAFFSGSRFTGRTTGQAVRVERAPRPGLTPGQRAQGVEAISIPGKEERTFPVPLPSSDYPYPLWPPLPTPVTVPALPTVPAPQKVKDDAEIRIPDEEGPGCGWAFLATVEPTFDEDQVRVNNEAILQSVRATLKADGKRWQRAVRAYWTAYHEYQAAVIAYRDYRREVESVAAAWDLIHQAWDEYYTAYANWEIRNDQREALIAEQELARQTLADQRAACKTYPAEYEAWQAEYVAWEEDHEAWEKEVDAYNKAYEQYQEDLAEWRRADPETRGDRPEPPEEPRPEPVPPAEPVLSHPCPPERPEVLDRKVPPAEEPPAQPADPRPVGERD